jgi:hypothetical protein
MVRIGRLAILASALFAATGCSSVFAAIGRPTDLSVLRKGASREEVEVELGRPKSERLMDDGVAATYGVRVGDRHTPIENAATVVGTGAQAVKSAGPTRVDTFFGFLVALPTMIVTDVILSTQEVSRLARSRRELTVYYDDLGYVLRFTEPVKR